MRYALLPLWGLIKRELIRDLRRPHPVFFMAAILILAGLVVVANYPRALVSATQMAMVSKIIFGGISTTLLAAALLLLPGYAATAIVVERESDTYDLLSLTLTRPSAIVLGKLFSSLGYFLLIETAMLPLVGATMFLVGIDAGLVGVSALYVTIIAVTCTSMGVMSSAVSRSTPRAVTLSYMSTFIALGGFLIPIGLLVALVQILDLDFLQPIVLPVAGFIYSFSPFGALGAFAGLGIGSSMVRVVLGQVAFSLMALLVARRMLARPSEERGFTSFTAPPPLPTGHLASAPLRLMAEHALPAWPPVRDDANPMYARERLQVRISQRMTPLRILLTAICVLLIILFLAFTLAETGGQSRARDAHIVVHAWMIGLAILMVFAAPGSSAAAWSREYERETMDLLRTTLLTPRQLVYGKAFSALRACLFAFVLAMLASLPLLPYPFLSARAAIHFAAGLMTIGVTTVLCVSVSTLMGLLNRRTSACILFGLVGSMAAIASPLLIALAYSLLTLLLWLPGEPFFWWYLSPITAYANVLEPDGPMLPQNLIIWSVCMAAQLALSGLILRAAVTLFTSRHLRDR